MTSIFKHILVAFFAIAAFMYYQRYVMFNSLPKPRVNGYFHPSFRKVAETFRANLESGMEMGASFSVYQNGQVLVDLCGGWADVESQRHWQEDTMSVAWSMTKGVSALTIGRLVDSGSLDYKKEVYHYWPEFGTDDKKNVTVEMLLSHQAGLIILDEQITMFDYQNDWPKVEKILARQKPVWPAGKGVGYHTMTWGMYADALVRRVDQQHRSIAEFFKQEIAEPFGLDFHIGLPPHLYYRLARFREFSMLEKRWNFFELLSFVLYPHGDQATKAVDVGEQLTSLMDPKLVQIGLPSAVGVGAARDLAKLYDYFANDGSIDGKHLLSKSTVKLLQENITENLEKRFLARHPFSRGVFIKTNKQGHEMIGHSGYGGSYSGADTTLRLGVAYLTNHLSLYFSDDPRAVSLYDAFYEGYDDYVKKMGK